MNSPGSIPAAVVALASAILDALTLLGVFQLDAQQKTAILTVLTSAAALAVLLIPIFEHNFAMAKLAAAGALSQTK